MLKYNIEINRLHQFWSMFFNNYAWMRTETNWQSLMSQSPQSSWHGRKDVGWADKPKDSWKRELLLPSQSEFKQTLQPQLKCGLLMNRKKKKRKENMDPSAWLKCAKLSPLMFVFVLIQLITSFYEFRFMYDRTMHSFKMIHYVGQLICLQSNSFSILCVIFFCFSTHSENIYSCTVTVIT